MVRIATTALGPSKFGLTLQEAGRALSFNAFIDLLGSSETFRHDWTRTLAQLPFSACRWECAPIYAGHDGAAFECVVSDHPALAETAADGRDFQAHFRGVPSGAVVDFDNLGGDARLVVPKPDNAAQTDYAHLLSFLRSGSDSQIQAFWQHLGQVLGRSGGMCRPLWVSTAGMGVYWLHVRLDTRPKYYEHASYRLAP